MIYDEKAVMERYGLKPSQLSDYRGLKGDPSDNIPGVPGIGEKTGSTLIQKYGSLENLYEHVGEIEGKLGEKLKENKDQAFFSKQLSQVVCDLDVDFSLDIARWRTHVDMAKLEALFAEFGFKSLGKRLQEINLGTQESLLPEYTEQHFTDLGMRDIYETIENRSYCSANTRIKIDVTMLLKLQNYLRHLTNWKIL